MTGAFSIQLSGMKFYSRHGLFPQESRVGNVFHVDLCIKLPKSEAEAPIALDDTISYADLYDEVKSVMDEPEPLLETLCVKIADRMKQRWQHIESGKVKITKDAPPISGFIGEASVIFEF